MGVIAVLGRVLRAVATLGLLLAVAGVVAWAVLPGGPLADGAVDQPQSPVEGDGSGVGGSTATDGTPPDAPVGTGPWDEAVLTVDVRNPAAPERNVTPAVVEALDYWAANAGYGDYVVEFRVAPGAPDPDLVVWYNESIHCPAHDDAIGCAPLLDSDSRIDRPVDVQVRYDPVDNRRQVRNTVIHEVGHVLGLDHCDEPYWVMASACDTTIPDAPDAADREVAFRERNLTVYLDEEGLDDDERAETREQVARAVTYLSNRTDGEFPTVSLRYVEDRFDADAVVTFPDPTDCGDGAVTCFSTRGRDFDGDGRIEYHTGGTVRIDAGSDVEARGWYAGWALSKLISPRNPPDVFADDTSYRERRSRWWEDG